MVKAQLKYVIHYLQNNGWDLNQDRLENEKVLCISKSFGNQIASFALPVSNQYADYDLRMNDLVHTLSQIENISEKAMVDKINSSDDIASDFLFHKIIPINTIEIAAH